nr:GspE/PulE family protein [Pannonibacter sp. XCT-34]
MSKISALKPEDLRDALVREGIVHSDRMDKIWDVHEETKTALARIILELGLTTEDRFAEFWSGWLGVQRFDDSIVVDDALGRLFPRGFLKASKIVPVASSDRDVTVAVVDPLNAEVLAAIQYITDKEVVPVCATTAEIEQLLLLQGAGEAGQRGGLFGGAQGGFAVSDAEALRSLANEGPIVQLANSIFADAYARGVSDIHLEPLGTALAVRYRIDGQLVEMRRFDHATRQAVVSRIKILSGMDITELRMPQDGRTSVVVGGHKIDVRVSTLPTVEGESVVMRLLVHDASKLDWDILGFDEEMITLLTGVISQPNGMFLVTGPTGSGKTTTLYTALSKLDRRARKVISIEDPVEYRLANVMQVHVNTEIGLDFPTALRTILRQDPDTIMIGEIRDLETAQIAIRASMTGHQVFSTLHTNGAIASYNRLSDMGVPRYLLSGHVNGIMSQRLVRRICSMCKEETGACHQSGYVTRDQRPVRLWRGLGCKACGYTGFKGRAIVCEVLIPDAAIREVIATSDNWMDVSKAAVASGFDPMFKRGLALVDQGVTSLEELLSVCGATD